MKMYLVTFTASAVWYEKRLLPFFADISNTLPPVDMKFSHVGFIVFIDSFMALKQTSAKRALPLYSQHRPL